MKPLISVIVPTYNRSKTIARAIDSMLAQSYENFEVIIIDDGSIDDTSQILQKYTDSRIKIILHAQNKGVTAAKNTGLNNIKGEWFTILDSDDEIIPEALQIMMRVPLELDSTITALTCNCIDSGTGNLSGKGLDFDQYVDFKTLIKCTGEFWGITKTELLLTDRFNENLNGLETTLWYKLYERSNRYYIHNGLRIYHTTGTDRISNNFSIKKKAKDYEALFKEEHYLHILKEYRPDYFAKECLLAVVYLKAENKIKVAKIYFQYLKEMKNYTLYKVISFFTYHSNKYLVKKGIKFGNLLNKLTK